MAKDGRGTNLAAIGEACGVTAMTVSRALRGDSRVADATRKRILAEAEAQGYRFKSNVGRPRRAAQVLRSAVNVIIGNAVGSQSWFYSKLLISIEQELARKKHDCIVRTCGRQYSDFLTLCQTLHASDGEKVLIVGYVPTDQLQAILDVAPNAILVDHTGDPHVEGAYQTVGFDNVEAARMGVRHLLKAGRRRIMLIKGFAEHYFSREIEQGYRQALADGDIEPDTASIIETDFTAESAESKVGEAIDGGLSFDAIFTNDEMATGVIRGLGQRGLTVPRDVAVCGCDGLPIGLQITPRLTTLKLDYRALGRLAVERLFAGDDDGSSRCRIRLVPELEIRESTVNTE